MMMAPVRIAALAILFGTLPAVAAPPRYYAYNMTTRTDFKGVYLAPAGTQDWGPNQTVNDKDHSLDTTERLRLTGISAGRYDVKLVDGHGHSCIARNKDLTQETSFEIRDADLADCR